MSKTKHAPEDVQINRACIYCGRVRPFSDEHVFPAGLGGDDRRFLLKEMVCGVCNSVVFSKLETKFMRSSPVAIGRIFLQPTGRGKGKKASIPSVQTRSTTVFLEPYGAVEAEVTALGKLVTLIQLIFLDGETALTGGDHVGADVFLDALHAKLERRLQVVEKVRNAVPPKFFIETFDWDGTQYLSSRREQTLDLPSKRVWRELLETAQPDGKTTRAPTLYQRTDGQICLRVTQTTDVARLLTIARKAVPGFKAQERVSYSNVENPLVHLSMSMDLADYGRVIAKIGVNLVAHAYGAEYARHHAFNKVKRAILEGHSPISVHTPPSPTDIFCGVPSNRHVAMLYFAKSRAGRFFVTLFIRLYGAKTLMVQLSENALPPAPHQAILVVDYINHRIERFSDLASFVTVYPPNRSLNFHAPAGTLAEGP